MSTPHSRPGPALRTSARRPGPRPTGERRARADHLRGLGRLGVEGTLGLTDLVEALHFTIQARPCPLGRPPSGRTRGVTGFVYRCVRGTARLVGKGLDAALAALAPLLGDAPSSRRRDRLVAVLNGVLGDRLAAGGSPLSLPMSVRRHGRPLVLEAGPLAAAVPGASGRVVLLVHGLCMDDAGWSRDGHDHGAALERDLHRTVLALSYNSGRHVSVNGRELDALLEALLSSWPVPVADLSIVAHSMGGLVTRSAVDAASRSGHAWVRHLGKVVFLGTPHHGAPLERLGNLVHHALGVSPYTLPFARLGLLRSAGITDLRHGNLLDEDWAELDRFARHGDRRRPPPLAEGIAWYTVAATRTRTGGSPGARLAGDGLVPVASALGRHRDPEKALRFPPERTWIAAGTGHFDLLSRPEVYERLRDWLG